MWTNDICFEWVGLFVEMRLKMLEILGHGEEALETTKDFSRYGRVTYVLKERNLLLRKVDKLSKILGEIGDVAYSCETAGYFYRYTVVQTWEHFVDALKIANDTLLPDSKERNEFVSKNFPFSKYFSTDKKPIDLFKVLFIFFNAFPIIKNSGTKSGRGFTNREALLRAHSRDFHEIGGVFGF